MQEWWELLAAELQGLVDARFRTGAQVGFTSFCAGCCCMHAECCWGACMGIFSGCRPAAAGMHILHRLHGGLTVLFAGLLLCACKAAVGRMCMGAGLPETQLMLIVLQVQCLRGL